LHDDDEEEEDDEGEEEEEEDVGRPHVRTWRIEARGATQSICSSVFMPVGEGAPRFHGFFSTIVTIATIATMSMHHLYVSFLFERSQVQISARANAL
jgi:helix-turn-helix protein